MPVCLVNNTLKCGHSEVAVRIDEHPKSRAGQIASPGLDVFRDQFPSSLRITGTDADNDSLLILLKGSRRFLKQLFPGFGLVLLQTA